MFNQLLINQAVRSNWNLGLDKEQITEQQLASICVLTGISPRDEFEGMLAAQMFACHNASMECYRRAMFSEQTFEGRNANLSQANRLSRTYSNLLEALNRHRRQGPAEDDCQACARP